MEGCGVQVESWEPVSSCQYWLLLLSGTRARHTWGLKALKDEWIDKYEDGEDSDEKERTATWEEDLVTGPLSKQEPDCKIAKVVEAKSEEVLLLLLLLFE